MGPVGHSPLRNTCHQRREIRVRKNEPFPNQHEQRATFVSYLFHSFGPRRVGFTFGSLRVDGEQQRAENGNHRPCRSLHHHRRVVSSRIQSTRAMGILLPASLVCQLYPNHKPSLLWSNRISGYGYSSIDEVYSPPYRSKAIQRQ